MKTLAPDLEYLHIMSHSLHVQWFLPRVISMLKRGNMLGVASVVLGAFILPMGCGGGGGGSSTSPTFTPPAQSVMVSTVAGVPGSNAVFDGALGLAVDGAGNIFVADSGKHTIDRITPQGAVSTIAGAAGQRGSADGLGAAARFNGPTGVAVDQLGYL